MVKCEYCGKIKEEDTFVIGASKEVDWCMHEGTGKMSCPDCYIKAEIEARIAINKFCGIK